MELPPEPVAVLGRVMDSPGAFHGPLLPGGLELWRRLEGPA